MKLSALKKAYDELQIIQSSKQECVKSPVDDLIPYDWQKTVWASAKTHDQRLVMAANQVGKTSLACIELYYHLTGLYPDDWVGYRFDHAINAWALGVSSEQILAVLQTRLLGVKTTNGFKDGYIPTQLIDYSSIRGGQLKNSVKYVLIKHVSGAYSELSFKSYEQGQHVMMGDIVDFVLIDEEPRDPAIYGQVLTRTLNANPPRGGLVLLTFTPENGYTELVHQYTEHLEPHQFLLNVTWDDAPHLTQEKKEKMLLSYPEHEREMRSKGIPQLGSGAIYPFSDEMLYDNRDYEIPPYWRRLCAIDFGFRHCALVWGAWDVDADILHIYEAIKTRDMVVEDVAKLMKSRGKWIPWAWPHDGHLPEKGKGKQQKELYEDEEVYMLSDHATFDDEGGYSVEAGIMRLSTRMKNGTIKIAPHLTEFFAEKRLYHRKDGKIVKKNDHLMDACRYLEMMLRYAITEHDSSYVMRPSYTHERFKPAR